MYTYKTLFTNILEHFFIKFMLGDTCVILKDILHHDNSDPVVLGQMHAKVNCFFPNHPLPLLKVFLNTKESDMKILTHIGDLIY